MPDHAQACYNLIRENRTEPLAIRAGGDYIYAYRDGWSEPAKSKGSIMLKYGEITRDESKLSDVSRNALLARGFSHYLGNEQASKVVAKIRAILANGGKASDVTKEAIKTWRENPENASKLETFEIECEQAALAALDNGTIGVHVSSGRVSRDPVQAAMTAIARREVSDVLKGAGLKTPKGEETVDMGGQAFTMEALIARRLEKHADRLHKEAERQVADAQRKAKRLQEESAKAKGANGATVEALGL